MMKVASPLRPSSAPRLLSLLCVAAALLLGGILGIASRGAAAQMAESIGVTYGQPKVFPAEFNGDLSKLPALQITIGEPRIQRPLLRGPPSMKQPTLAPPPPAPAISGAPLVPMPGPLQNFPGLSKTDLCTGGTCGGGWPPDPNGDVGPSHYIQVVNTAVAIYNKTGTLLASFTENQLWSGAASPPCTGNSQGDPVALYDWLADRFVITWFAFTSSSGPFYQCIAASKTSDPVAGGWWLYPVRMDPGTAGTPPAGYLNDYAKFGLWHDCLYMGANEFLGFGAYQGASFASFSRADMYSGAPLTYSLGFLAYPANSVFAMFPSNNNGKGANAAQPGTPNYFVMESLTSFAFQVRKFTAGPNCGAGGTLGAPTSVSQTSYGTTTYGSVVPQPNTTIKLDNIDDRIMQKVQYRKIGGAESLWVTHNVQGASSLTAMQWAQINVSGGTIVTTPVQQQIHQPDTTLWRWMGSLAVDGQGNMALGYSTSNGTAPNFPSIAYSGRLAGDPLNTLPQTETQLIAGAGSQVNNCGGASCDRWGDYSSMSVDPLDDCTFWYTTEYYSSQANGNAGNWQTRIGSFKFPSCVAAQTNVALASAGAVASASSTFSAAFPVAAVNNGDRTGAGWGAGGGWNDATLGVFPDYVQIVFNGWKTIDHVIAYTLQDNVANPIEPTDSTTFSLYGVTAFTVQGWNGTNWVTLGTVSGNNLVKRTVNFSAFTTDRIRINVTNALNSYSRIVEIEAFGVPAASQQNNVAAAALGGVASASSTFSAGYPVAAVNNGDRTGAGWGAGGGWNDATAGIFPDLVQIVFNGQKTIDHVIVYTLQDNFGSPVEPSDVMTFSNYGVTAFDVQGWNGVAWVTLGTVNGNNLVKRRVNFSAFTTDRIRINVTNALAAYSRIVEVEAFGVAAGPEQSNVASVDAAAVASASSSFSAGYPVAAVNNGDRAGIVWGSGGGWNDATLGVFPDFVQILFNGSKTIDRVIVYTLQDNFGSPVEPADTMTFGTWGITDFSVDGWNGSTWVPLGTVTGNNLVKRTVNFAAFATDRIRVNVNNALNSYSRIVEIEAWGN
jgi:hypothetical protein